MLLGGGRAGCGRFAFSVKIGPAGAGQAREAEAGLRSGGRRSAGPKGERSMVGRGVERNKLKKRV
jgi:hypothetical protein